MKFIRAALFSFLGLAPLSALASEDVMIVYDGSNSMWGQIDGVAKIETARDVLAGLIKTWPETTNLGLMAYGHRREGDCSDIEVMIPPGPINAAPFMETVNSIVPRGKTPLTAAVEQAAEALSYRDNPATVVLISDGIESCQADPCSIAATLEAQGVAFTTHVIGFDIAQEDQQQLSCIAENTGGTFVLAQDADELRDAMAQVKQVIEAAPEPEPEPEPEVVLTLTAPEQVEVGQLFEVAWSRSLNPDDLMLVAPAGSDDEARLSYTFADEELEGALTAPSEPGLYEVRYRLKMDDKVVASVPLEVVAAGISITAPEQVEVGQRFKVTWSQSLSPDDVMLVAPAGSDDEARMSFTFADEELEAALTAPSEPGLYEVRYRLKMDEKVIASVSLEVVAAGISITAPEQVEAGQRLKVTWSQSLSPDDVMLIAPAGSDDEARMSFTFADEELEGALIAPSEPGLYEVRYRLKMDEKVIASAPLEVVAADVSITAPAKVVTGEQFKVAWSKSLNRDDMMLIAPAGANDSEKMTFTFADEELEGALTAPSEPGLYEVRYRLKMDEKVIASVPLEVVPVGASTASDAQLAAEASAGLAVPDSAMPGEALTVTWTIAPTGADWRVVVAKEKAPDFTWISSYTVGDTTQTELAMPDEPGAYEVRFLDLDNQDVLGRVAVTVRE